MIRRFLYTLSALMGVAAFVLIFAPIDVRAAEKIKFNMSWLPQGSTAGFIVAGELGLYEKEGLDVEVQRGYGGLRTVNEVASGLFEFGYGDPQGMVLNRTKGGKTKMIGTINDTLPIALCWDAAKLNIKKPEDLDGKKVGGGAQSPIQIILPILMANSGKGSVTMIRMDPAVTIPAVLSGQTDVSDCWAGSNLGIAKGMAAEKGMKLGHAFLRDIFGLDTYGNGIVTNEQVIATRPHIISKFVRASYKGYSWMFKNMDAAVDMVIKRYPTVKHAIVLDQVRDMVPLMKGPEFDTKGFGWIDREKMKRTRDFIVKGWDVKTDIPLDDLYTNEFLKGDPIK
ncbi:MAG: ABC transporter substrate-binding protein [Deltaproteobacteria bacterium]|nr:ABC transporter substrate-binding protein [Deltaproteobacteria bacterium]